MGLLPMAMCYMIPLDIIALHGQNLRANWHEVTSFKHKKAMELARYTDG